MEKDYPVFKYLISVLLMLVILPAAPLRSQGTQEQFGQNRVQYKDFTWQFYESEHFSIYFNQGGQLLGQFTANIAESNLAEIEELLDYRSSRDISIMVYNTISDFNQTNIGSDNQEFYNTGGRTKIIDNKIFVYFNGDHTHLVRQVREGISQILVSNMVFGGNLQEIVQNAVLLNLPEWFVLGLESFIGEEWSSEYDNELRDLLMSGKLDKFNKLTGRDARFAGHSLWYYIAEKYGRSNIPNLLYLIRINRSVENGFLFVLGGSVNQVISDAREYFLKKYNSESKVRTVPPENSLVQKRFRKKYEYYNLKLSPDAKKFAYVTNESGRFKVHLQEFDKKRSQVLKRGGYRTRSIAIDNSYPLLAWAPRGNSLAVIFEKRGKTRLVLYDTETKKKTEDKEIARFQKILSASFTNDSRKLVISAMNKGQSDIYIYYVINARLEQLTNDFFDDLNPGFVSLENKEGVIFSSNREQDTLYNMRLDSVMPTDKMDLFFYDLKGDGKSLIRISDTPGSTEKDPQEYDKKHFTFLSDVNGIYNRFAGYFDSVYSHTDKYYYFRDSLVLNPAFDVETDEIRPLIDSVVSVDVYRDTAYSFPISNYASNIIEQDVSPRARKSMEVFLQNGRREFYVQNTIDSLSAEDLIPLVGTSYQTYRFKQLKGSASKSNGDSLKLPKIRDFTIPDSLRVSPLLAEEPKVVEYYFQEQFPENTAEVYPKTGLKESGQRNDQNDPNKFRKSKVRPYRLNFSTDYVMTQLDNGLFINKYENFTAGGGSFTNPDLSALFTVSVSDLFEDYRFTGGFRIPTSFSGSEYFLSFEDRKKRLDKQFLYYYRANNQRYLIEQSFNPIEAKVRTNVAQFSLKYPLDVVRSFRGHFTYRNDKIQFQATDLLSLQLPNFKEDWLSFKFEYIFDNTYPVSINILNGMRYKVWYEIHKRFEVNRDDGLNVSFDDGVLSVLGVDFRHYQRIHRQIVWANRFAAATSFGSSKLIYYLGGVDSWISPQFNNDTEIDFNAGYAFQTLATNMRGFQQNARNGNSYAVINSELRVPLFTYLFNRPIRSEIIRSFQVVGFFDVGTAWQGLSPFNDENKFNTVEVPENPSPVVVEVNYFRNPLVAGYGAGIRSKIFGYFLRVDLAWGIDSGIINDPIWYFSLSTDF